MLVNPTADVLILCGGLGQRFRTINPDQPKILCDIHGKIFLDILLDHLVSHGFSRYIFATGYLGDQIQSHCQNYAHVTLCFSQETTPLGTAGAIKKAEPFIKSDPFLVINGDSYCPADLIDLLRFHTKHHAFLSMLLVQSQNVKNSGCVTLDTQKRITSFEEKPNHLHPAIVNAGTYVMSKSILSEIPATQEVSLEKTIFPSIVKYPCYGYTTGEPLVDIGTPEGYTDAIQNIFKN